MQWPPTRPGPERQEVPLGAGRLQHFLGVDAEAVEDQRQLVDQRDVDVALRVLDHLGRFGDADARRLVRAGLDDARVQRVDEVGDFRRRARGDLLDRRQAMLLVARVDALRAVAGEEVAVELQARQRARGSARDLLGAARIDRGLEHDDVALLQHLAEQLARAHDRREVRPLVAVDRRRHGDDEDLAGRAGPSRWSCSSGASRRAARPARTSSVLSRPFFSSAMRAALMSKPTVWKCLPNSTASGRPT